MARAGIPYQCKVVKKCDLIFRQTSLAPWIKMRRCTRWQDVNGLPLIQANNPLGGFRRMWRSVRCNHLEILLLLLMLRRWRGLHQQHLPSPAYCRQSIMFLILSLLPLLPLLPLLRQLLQEQNEAMARHKKWGPCHAFFPCFSDNLSLPLSQYL